MKSVIKKTSILVAAAATIMISFSAQAGFLGFLVGGPWGCCSACTDCRSWNRYQAEEPVCPTCEHKSYNY